MKKTLILIAGALILFGSAGCQETNKADDAITEAENKFPAFLIGTWQADKMDWVFTFEADGSISKMKHRNGVEFDIAEGGLTMPGRKGVELIIYALGPCEAHYDSQKHELNVTIVIDSHIIQFVDGSVESNYRDDFTGQLSQDNMTWNAAWTSTGEIVGFGSNTAKVRDLIFTKVSDDTEK